MNIKNNKRNVCYINMNKYIILFSYETIICVYDREQNKVIKTDKFYSRTTSKHFNQFMNYYGFDKTDIKIVFDEEFKNITNNL